MWAYVASFLSGLFVGALELCREHRRMKSEALISFWGIVYVVAAGLTACAVFFLCGPRISSLIAAQSNPTKGDNIFLGLASGGLAPFILKRLGREGQMGDFVSYHGQLLSFFREEVKRSTRIQRLELAHNVVESWKDRVTELNQMVMDYVRHVETDMERQKEYVRYIESCMEEGKLLETAILLIELYGTRWAKKHLLHQRKSPRFS